MASTRTSFASVFCIISRRALLDRTFEIEQSRASLVNVNLNLKQWQLRCLLEQLEGYESNDVLPNDELSLERLATLARKMAIVHETTFQI